MKKKIYLSVVAMFVWALSGFAQFSVQSPAEFIQITTEADIDAVFLFNGITMSTEIRYNGTENFEWRKYDNSFVANTANFSPEDGTGYIVFDKDQNRPIKHIWVIDYSLYPASISAVTPNGSCAALNVNVAMSAGDLAYYNKNNQRKTLKRTFKVSYTDYVYKDSTWQDEEVNETFTYPATNLSFRAPKKDISLCISGDSYAEEMGLAVSELCVDYAAIAVECHPKGEVEKRDGTNEYKRDDSGAKGVSGSGPLVVALTSNANSPTAAFFEWKIYKIETPAAYQRYSSEELRYTFTETGEYTALLTVKNSDGTCEHQDSIHISVLESLLDVPNAFSPNGDGINDEFRVVFKSLKTYNIVIYNRWGRVVYKSDDPSKGWDGRIGGRVAAAGTYYYIIEATGTDKYQEGKHKGQNVRYSKKGHINLFK